MLIQDAQRKNSKFLLFLVFKRGLQRERERELSIEIGCPEKVFEKISLLSVGTGCSAKKKSKFYFYDEIKTL